MTKLMLSVLSVSLLACGSKKEEPPAADKSAEKPIEKPIEKKDETKPAAVIPPEAPKAAPAAKLVETDLSKFGPAFKGYVAMVPEGAKLEYDDPSRHITLSDTDFVSISEAPYWEDGMKSLATDKDNKNIKNVSATEVTYERTPPLGTAWAVDVMVTVNKAKYSCTAGDPGTFTSAAMRDSIADICKSIKKK